MSAADRLLDAALIDVAACPLCGDDRHDAESTPPPNLYSEQLSLVLGCDESQLLAAVHNRRCARCGLWYKPRWFRAEGLRSLFTARVPDHPKGWDAVSDRFSMHGFLDQAQACAEAVRAGTTQDVARHRRGLASIIDSITGIDAGLRHQLLQAIADADMARVQVLAPQLHGHFDQPAAFKRFSGFSSPLLWDWMQSHLGPVQRYAEVGCPLWGQLARAAPGAGTRIYFDRAENNYWGSGCRREGRHCSARLADGGAVQLLPWPPAPGLALDVIGAFQYLDHLEDPAAFVAEVFEHARALLLILDNVDAPVAIQHATGWGRAPLAWLADAHGKRLVDDFAAITPSGNHAWLLCDD